MERRRKQAEQLGVTLQEDPEPAGLAACRQEQERMVVVGRVDEAVAACEQALALDDKSAELHNDLGNAWFALKRYNEAAEEYLKVATATQDRRLRHSAYLAMGNALVAAKRPDGAVRAFADAARLKPDRRTLEALLNAQQVSGQHAESIGTLGQLLRVSPSDERRQQLAQLLEQHGRPAEAARELKHLTSNGSTLATRRGAWRQLGEIADRRSAATRRDWLVSANTHDRSSFPIGSPTPSNLPQTTE